MINIYIPALNNSSCKSTVNNCKFSSGLNLQIIALQSSVGYSCNMTRFNVNNITL